MSKIRVARAGTSSRSRDSIFRRRFRRERKLFTGTSLGIPELTDASHSESTSGIEGDFIESDLNVKCANKRLSIDWIQSSLRRHASRCYKEIVTICTDDIGCSNDSNACLFWSSRTMKLIYTNVALALILRQPLLLYATLFILLRNIATVCSAWSGYFAQDQEARKAFKILRFFFRIIIAESEKAVQGDYSRQIVAGYLIYNAALAPGASYISYALRYKMNALNMRMVQEMKEWRRERRLS